MSDRLNSKPDLEGLLMRQHNAVIEECARVAEQSYERGNYGMAVAAAIRALKRSDAETMSEVVCYVVTRAAEAVAVFTSEWQAREFADAQADNMKEDRRLWSIDIVPFNPGHW